jgi:hypothetical protein
MKGALRVSASKRASPPASPALPLMIFRMVAFRVPLVDMKLAVPPPETKRSGWGA